MILGINWQEALLNAWQPIWAAFTGFLPRFVGALVVFVIGLLIASWLKRLVEAALKMVHFQEFSKKIGAEAFWKRAEIKLTTIQIIGLFVKWFIILVFFIATVDILGLTAVSVVLTSFLAFIPNVVSAALIFGAGFIVAGLVEGLIKGALTTVEHEAAKPVGKLARWAVIVIAFFAAISELKVAQELVETFFTGLTWTIVLAVGLAIGFGTKDVVAKILNDWYDKLKK
ncbi:MAG TPA: hypothetical protein VMX77_01510 [Candidatus Bathyarchaeia archaeon]|nr:hypothetical protein [Candidatus Bathyarchaeia archaeon]